MDLCFALPRYQQARALKGLALVVLGAHGEGEICLEEVLKTGISRLTAHLGMVFSSYLKKKGSAAKCHLESVVQNISFVFRPLSKVLLLLASAVVAIQAGENRESRELLSSVFHHPNCPTELFKAWDLAGGLAAKLKSRMTPDEFESAWKPGDRPDMIG